MGPKAKLVMCTAIAMIALPSLASAHKIRADSAVSAQAVKGGGTNGTPACVVYGPPFVVPCPPHYSVWGWVTSSRSSCVAGRTVTLYRVRDDGATKVETTETTNDGEYFVFLSWGTPPAGEYYVDVAKRRAGKRGHRHVCRAARSSTVRFASP